MCKKLNYIYQYPEIANIFKELSSKTLVVSGGVASNEFILNNIRKISNHFGFEVRVPPQHLCTDNGEMIAWTGVEIINNYPSDVIDYLNLPTSLYCNARKDIGTTNIRDSIINNSMFKVNRKLRTDALLFDNLHFIGRPIK